MGLFGKKKEELPVEEEEWPVSDEQIDFSAFEYTVPENEAFFEKLSNGLEKTRASFIKNIDYAFNGYKQIDDDFYEELEEILITGDIGVRTTDSILTRLQEQIKEQKVMSPAECKGLLIDSIRKEMALPPNAYDFEDQTSVLFIVGV
ncbi:MAG: signal recognition particle receptor subunit alpha, partial [Solobacterium sp.]|nr:signal recognition particle receptor subunit alpha [Solobacterium sp.]